MTTARRRHSWQGMGVAVRAATVLLATYGLGAQSVEPKRPYTTWSDYAGSADSMQYSALDQIDATNVGALELVWSHKAPGPSGRFSFGPLIVDDVMYVVGKDNAVVALEAATGRQLWSTPLDETPTNRGFNYWESPDRADRRLIFAVRSHLRQIDARTGEWIRSFGKDGRVDLRDGIARAGNLQSGTPGRVFENLIILGSATGEGYGSAPGDLRAFDVRTGRLVWTFHTIPLPGEFGYDTWPPDAWKYVGGANTWGEISVDEKRGIVYFPTGSPTFDLYGGDRLGANLFGNCLLALDARTGKRLWHYQLVHHDLWDYDLVASPKLLTLRHKGRMVDAVAQATKTGMLYVFDRVSGEPIWPIEERPVPRSDVPGERSWPTQPFSSLPPFSRQSFGADQLNPYVEASERETLKQRLLASRNEGVFTPPSLTREFIVVPSQHGGANFGAVAADPATGMVYVRTVDAPSIHQLSPWDPSAIRGEGETPAERGLSVYAQACQTCHGDARPEGIRSLDRASVIAVKQLGEQRVTNTVRQGQGQMPAFPETRLSSGSLEALLTYLSDPTAAPGPARVPRPLPLSTEQVRYTGPLGSTYRTQSGLPAIGPPWSRIVAYDLNEGTIEWAVPLGTVPELAAKGITDTGNANRVHRNGLVVTAGGLVFVGTHGDRTVRAFAKDTGKILWERQLPAGPEGMPAVYQAGGRQFVAFFASTPQGGASAGEQGYYVFALPGGGIRPTQLQGATPGQAPVSAPGQAAGAATPPQSAPQPVSSISERPNGASLGTIRIGASDEKIWFGWRVAMPATAIKGLTFSEVLASSDKLAVAGVEASSTQVTSVEVPKPLDHRLRQGERRAVVHRLRELNQQLTAYRVGDLGTDTATRRRVFEFAKAIGAPLIVTPFTDTIAAQLAELDTLAEAVGVAVAFEAPGDPAAALRALEGRSMRLGLAVDVRAWIRHDGKPFERLPAIKDRLKAVRITGGSVAANGRAGALGDAETGAVGEFLLAAYRAHVKGLTIVVESSGATEQAMLASLDAFERVMWPAMAERVRRMVASPPGRIRAPDLLTPEVRSQIEAAAPREAVATPRKPRKLLVTDLQMYSGHATIPHGNLLLELMGKHTGAFEPVFSNDLELLKYPRIKEFDAIYLNNVCGMVHNDPEVREGILRFVREGGGIAGHHAVTYANNNWPEFAEMMGGWAGAHHVETQTLKIDDQTNPLTRSFGTGSFEHTDEYYVFPPGSPYSRAKQRVLMSIDVAASDRATLGRFCAACTRPDQDYGVAWIRTYGKGRAYFTPLGHTVGFYTDRRWTQHILAAIQYVLGDLDADATPNGKRSAR
jgi:quinoprotein glucose dehydrogenase